jgi:NADH dehydrogenase/NADH:ubiquinone oxidoreductase subunit G
MSAGAGQGQLVRLSTTDRRPIRLLLDGRPVEALEGDSLLTALLLAGRHLRRFEFGEGLRAGFCLMGACQDCWVALEDGRRLRACTTLAEDGMAVRTSL